MSVKQQKASARSTQYQGSRGNRSTFHQSDQRWRAEASNPETNAERLTELSTDPYLRMVVAGNPDAPASLLMHLAQDRNRQVRQAVASNPNTPWPILEHLAWMFPHAYLSNPISPLQMMAHPEQICTDGIFYDALLREASIPPLWWS